MCVSVCVSMNKSRSYNADESCNTSRYLLHSLAVDLVKSQRNLNFHSVHESIIRSCLLFFVLKESRRGSEVLKFETSLKLGDSGV